MIKKQAVAGTLESSDIQITIGPHISEENLIELESPVKHLFEEEILKVMTRVLKAHQVTGAHIRAIDKGALNCTIAARMQTAIYRAQESDIDWEVI